MAKRGLRFQSWQDSSKKRISPCGVGDRQWRRKFSPLARRAHFAKQEFGYTMYTPTASY